MQNTQFYEDLERSHIESKKPYWREAYKRYFSDAGLTTDLVLPVEDRVDNGIDKLVTLSNGRALTVDEKVAHNPYFQDSMIFLEMHDLYPDGSYKRDGWIKDFSKKCDYLAYSKKTTELVYIFPFRELQEAFKKHSADWITRFTPKQTPNYSVAGEALYFTECLLVPAEEIQEAIMTHFVVPVPHKFWT